MYVLESNYCVHSRITLESFWGRRQNKEYARHEKPLLYDVAIATHRSPTTVHERILVTVTLGGPTQRFSKSFFFIPTNLWFISKCEQQDTNCPLNSILAAD